jgi:peptide/nickel transport system permease protein
MITFTLRRLAAAVPLLLGVSFFVFSLIHLAPGSPELVLSGEHQTDPHTIEAIRKEYHLNDPFLVQYGSWLVNVLRGDLGRSIAFHDSVTHVITPRVAPTLELASYALLLIVSVGLGLGMTSALQRHRWSGRLSSGLMLTTSTVSPAVSGILLIVIFGSVLGWFPLFGLGGSGFDRVYHLTLPAFALALGLVALVGRTCQASLSRVLDEGYVDAARSRGFSESRVILSHALRTAMLPVITITGLVFGFLIVGTVLVEYTFGLNGLGGLLVQSVQAKDFAVVQAVTLLFAATFVLINLVVDIVHAMVDPRVRLTTQVSA